MADCVAMPLNWIRTLQSDAIRSRSSSCIARKRFKAGWGAMPGGKVDGMTGYGDTAGARVDGKPPLSGLVTYGPCEARVFRSFDFFDLCPISHFTNHRIRSSLASRYDL